MELIDILTEGNKASEENVEKRRIALNCSNMLGKEGTREAEEAREAIMKWLAADATGR